MVFPIVGGTQSTDYEISNSLRFHDGDSADLRLALGSSPSGSNTNATFSFWIKRGTIADQQILYNHYVDANNYFRINLRSATAGTAPAGLELVNIAGGSDAGSRMTNRVFRDVSAWYHIVVSTDSDNSTEDDRVKLYINGTRYTDWASTATWATTFKHFADNATVYIGTREGSSQYFDGYLTEVNVVDGTEYDASNFGEFNDNGVWIPKQYTGGYGNNGHFLQFKQTGTGTASASTIGADTSGNDKHFTSTNFAATDITEDTCTNNFCTMNPLYSYTGITFKEGNLQTDLGGSNHRWGTGTFFLESGKWYFECKVLSDNNLNSGPGIIAYGIDDPLTTEGGGAGSKAEGWIYLSTSAGDLQHGGTQYGTASAATTNDILMVAVDIDNGKIWIGKNGTWSEGSNPSTGNGAVRSDLGDASSGLFTPAISGYNENFQFNFGNPPFSISSGNSDGKYGNFEYEVPSGYYAICTKRLAEFG